MFIFMSDFNMGQSNDPIDEAACCSDNAIG